MSILSENENQEVFPINFFNRQRIPD